MNRLFRIGAASLAAILFVSLAGCSGTPAQGGSSSTASTATAAKPDAWSLFKAAAEKSNALDSVDMDFAMKITVDVSGSTIATNLSGNVKAAGKGEERKAATTANMEILGQTTSMVSYYADGFSYTDTFGMKVKTPVSYEDYTEEAGFSFVDTNVMAESDFKDATVTEENGSTKISLPMSEGLAKKLAGNAIESAGSGDIDETSETKITEFTAVFVIDAAGYLSEMTIDCNASTTAEMPDMNGSESTTQQEMLMVINMTMKYLNPGQDITVTLPENLDEYEEMSDLGDLGDLGGLDL